MVLRAALRRAGCALAVAGVGLCAAPPAHAGVLDDLLGRQWPLAADGPLDVRAAWRASSGAGVVVAVLDTGVDLGHRDLAGAAWTNAGEVPGNGVDDDRNGWVDDVHGIDLVDGDGDPSDEEGHGTHVAGTIAARAGDGGVVGVAPGALVLPVRVLGTRREGDARDVAKGIEYALDHGAQVINVSVNGDVVSEDLRRALRRATALGVPVVASAGNDARDLAVAPSYPAAYPEPSVVAVAATDRDGALAPFSNFGPGVVDLAAPGVHVLSSKRGGGHEWRSGTSMAAPHVTGALALLRAARPDLDLAGLRAALDTGAAKPPALAGRVRSGLLSVAGALRTVVDAARLAAPAPAVLHARVRRRAKHRPRTLVGWTLAGDAPGLARFDVRDARGRLLARRGPDGTGAWVRRRTGTLTLRALDAAGAVITTARLRLR